jgi:hypothetical protein
VPIWGVVFDLVFDVLVEHLVFGLGGRTLWALRLGRVTLTDQMQATVPNLVAGLSIWCGLVALVVLAL